MSIIEATKHGSPSQLDWFRVKERVQHFPDKRTALLAAFGSRFGIGFVIPLVQLPWPGWLIGLVIGLLLSLPDAIVTKTYAPILLSGAIGGLIIGGLTHGWAMRA